MVRSTLRLLAKTLGGEGNRTDDYILPDSDPNESWKPVRKYGLFKIGKYFLPTNTEIPLKYTPSITRRPCPPTGTRFKYTSLLVVLLKSNAHARGMSARDRCCDRALLATSWRRRVATGQVQPARLHCHLQSS